MKRIARLATLLGILAVVTTGSLAGASTAGIAAPTSLHGFLLTATEPATTTFHRTPSFAWKPAPGAVRYELQLSTSAAFRDNGILFDSKNYLTPVADPSITLPWITGSPHSLYARVRAIYATHGVSPWSAEYGFDVVPPAAPTPMSSYDGLLRWTPVAGATGYQIWFVDIGKIETVNTNVLDEREFYAFHANQTWIGHVRWRVRALRLNVLGLQNGLPVATHGKWSPVYNSANASLVDAPLHLVGTISDSFSDGSAGSKAHTLMPGFVWTGDEGLGGTPASFFRVEVFTDSDCLNRVWTSATVASPAYAPRPFGPLAMPTDSGALDAATTTALADGSEASDYTADGDKLVPNEQASPATPTTSADGSRGTLTVVDPTSIGAPVDLWDTAWPSSGYYWTVMPVAMVADSNGTLSYYDMELAQDVCAAGRVKRFGISSEPSVTAKRLAFASGLSATGHLISADHAAKFYGQPLVAWTPAAAATPYEVQWAKSAYPFHAAGTRLTFATSLVLPLKPGTWFYRVRGFDYNMPSDAQEMSWSTPTRIVVARPKLTIR
jgi:hypothetical protein